MAWLFTFTLFLSAGLLFLVEPMCAKMLLPTLGGTPAVWTTCMVFFQASLLLGYCYAHFGPRLLGLKKHALAHLAVLGLAFLSLPIFMPRAGTPPTLPIIWLLQTLVIYVGLPFFAAASSGPLLQRWFTRAACQDPYFLYAASNLGSFAALVIYPSLLEPLLTLREQANLWMAGYGCLVIASFACAVCVIASSRRERPATLTAREQTLPERPAWTTRLRWLLLALVPSSLMLSVTTYLSTDIAAIPLLWVIPLGIYLLTFTLAFARKQIISHRVLVRWMPMLVLALALLILLEGTEPLLAVLGLHLLGLFWLALVCHGELARTCPPADRLTEFYLWLALGGVLGGLFNVILAPLLFTSLAEYPLMIALACLLGPTPSPGEYLKANLAIAMLVGGFTLILVLLGRLFDLEPGPISVVAMFTVPLVIVYTLQYRPLAFGLGLALIFVASSLYPGVHGISIFRQRSFFGVHRVTVQDGFRKLFNGNILHGQESLDPLRRDEPLTYYHRTGPIGQVMTALQGTDRLKRVGLVGLGIGALASYAQEGEHWTFFEIDPVVVHIASPDTGLFNYLKDSRGRIDVVVGDGRLALSRHTDQFGLLVIDAFGSDAIPVHLLTRQALEVYTSHLEENGLLAFHISNNYVDLEPVLADLARAAQPPMVCLIQKDLDLSDAERRRGNSPSVWVLMARSTYDLRPFEQGRWRPAKDRPGLGVWTDDFSNLLSVLRLGN